MTWMFVLDGINQMADEKYLKSLSPEERHNVLSRRLEERKIAAIESLASATRLIAYANEYDK